jgi:ComF family protein
MFLDLIFPKKCLGCGKTGGYFCSDCLNLISLDPARICPVCERPALGGFTHPGCLSSYSLDGFTAVFAYRGLIKKAIKKLKYKFVSDLASDLVELFLSFCGEDKAFSQFCQQEKVFFVPIPLHPSRLRWRGFNQAELLGKMIVQNLGLRFSPNLLLRIKKTKPQVDLTEEERRKNIQGAFKLSNNYPLSIIHSPLIIFDDVWTSGATLREAAKVLKRNGAKKVWGLTMAR